MSYINGMIKELVRSRDNYTSYYFAKWWVELGLVASEEFGFWFEDAIQDTSNQLAQNFRVCENRAWPCSFVLDISNRWYTVISDDPSNTTTCTSDNAFVLQEWESLILPLFVDTRSVLQTWEAWVAQQSILPELDMWLMFPSVATNTWGYDIQLWFSPWSWHDEINRDILVQVYSWVWNSVDMRMFINDFLDDTTPSYQSDDLTQSDEILSKRQKFGTLANFLAIQNPRKVPLLYCLSVQDSWEYGVATQYTFVDSRWYFGDGQSSLQARKKKILPDWLFQTVIVY